MYAYGLRHKKHHTKTFFGSPGAFATNTARKCPDISTGISSCVTLTIFETLSQRAVSGLAAAQLSLLSSPPPKVRIRSYTCTVMCMWYDMFCKNVWYIQYDVCQCFAEILNFIVDTGLNLNKTLTIIILFIQHILTTLLFASLTFKTLFFYFFNIFIFQNIFWIIYIENTVFFLVVVCFIIVFVCLSSTM